MLYDLSVLGTLVATLAGNLYLLFGTIFFASLAVVAGLVDRSGNTTFRIARCWSAGLLAAAGLRVETSLEEGLPHPGPVVYMANHQSLFDIPALLVSLPGQARMLAKRSLFRIPIFGWSLRLGGFIAIDRDNRSSAKESFDAAVARLAAGTSALIFPEGTRSQDGRLLPFQRGGLLLALKSGLPIVPVGIRGTLEAQPARSFVIRPGKVEVAYGQPIPTAGLGVSGRRELAATIQGEVARLARTEVAQ